MLEEGRENTGFLKPSQYGGYSIEFERDFDKDINDVWSVLTEPDRMVDWYADASGDSSLGGRLELHFPNSGAVAYAMVTQHDAPYVFEHMWVTGQLEAPAQPMPDELAARGGQCGDLTLASSIIRFALDPIENRGTRVKMSHYVPLNPRLLGQGLVEATRESPNPVSETPAPDMVLATWDILMDQLESAVANPGIRTMSRSADRSAGWAWDRFDDLRRGYMVILRGGSTNDQGETSQSVAADTGSRRQSMNRPDLGNRPESLEVVRDVTVSPEIVFNAFTGPRFENWFAAKGSLTMRAEPGAPFFFETEFEDQRHAHYGRFLDLQPSRRIEMTWLTEDGTRGAETVVSIDIEPIAVGTRVTLRHMGFPDPESRRRHEEAWPEILKMLENLPDG